MRKALALILAVTMAVLCLSACGSKPAATTTTAKAPEQTTKAPEQTTTAAPTPSTPLTKTQEIIKQAQSMTLEELMKKAIEESNGKTLSGIGNSSRGKTAGASFVAALQKMDSSYTGTIEWSQPKSNSIFTALNADSKSANPNYFMTLIQDGNQIQSKMVDTGVLRTFIPKEWAEANKINADEYTGLLALQTLNKVFMFNNTGSATYTNCWDFVAEGVKPLYMGVNSELVGKNFLYMLTQDKYATYLKEAYDALPADKQAYFASVVSEVEPLVATLLGDGASANAKYALAWIELWCGQYNEQSDDGPICTTLVDKSSVDACGLLVYSKLRSVQESDTVSKNNITVAAYQDGYKGIGGYGYCHYLMIPDSTPYPWTACAFISYMVTEVEGFAPWGKDMGGYSSNPVVAAGIDEKYNHKQGGYEDGVNKYDCKNDRGYDWWVGQGQLVLEDPAYCAEVSVNLSDWIDILVSGV